MADRVETLRLAITTPQGEPPPDDFVRLEREAVDPNDTFLSLPAVYSYISNGLFGTAYYVPPPPMQATQYPAKVYAFPSRHGLPYRLGVSHGLMQGPIIEFIRTEESVQVVFNQDPQLRYPASVIYQTSWLGPVYNEQGEEISPPAVTITGDNIRIPIRVYGVLVIAYLAIRHTYNIIADGRAGEIEEVFQSYAYAVWAGGNTFIEAIGASEAPPTIDTSMPRFPWLDGDVRIPPDDDDDDDPGDWVASGSDKSGTYNCCTEEYSGDDTILDYIMVGLSSFCTAREGE